MEQPPLPLRARVAALGWFLVSSALRRRCCRDGTRTALLTMGLLTMGLLTMGLLTMELLTMELLTMMG